MVVKEILKKAEKSSETAYDRKKPNMLLIWVIIIAIVILAAGNFTKAEDNENSNTKTVKTSNYEKEQEERLEKVLKKIDGAGDVSVYIRFDDGGEVVPAKDIKSSTDESGDSLKTESEEVVVMSGRSSNAQPYTLKEKTPRVSGALIVATGASDESVRIKIYEAVRAIYGISPHRIQVTY